MYNKILIKYGDLTLKGKNKNVFVNKVYSMVVNRFKEDNISIERTFDRMLITLNDMPYQEAIEKLNTVSGLYSYVLVASCPTEIQDIKELAKQVVIDNIGSEFSKFKIETKRSYKKFPMDSMEVSKDVSGYLLKQLDGQLKADMNNPDFKLMIEIKHDETYIYSNRNVIRGLGGYPCGVGGRGLLMISGGIDSPVAGFLMQKQGIEIEAIHFESTPLTSVESAQKVIDLCKKMSKFAPKQTMRVHMVHFREIHEALLAHVPESYNITIMRRLMYKIADKFARKRGVEIICNGESVGQVASQTLGSMVAVNAVTNLPIIRPLATYDKVDIIAIAKKIDTYNLSILPFEDCCTVYVPKNPTTNPKIEKCLDYEQNYDFEKLVDDAVSSILTITVSPDSDLNITLEGFEVKQILENM